MKFNFPSSRITLWLRRQTKAMEPNADLLEWPKKDKHLGYFMLCIAQVTLSVPLKMKFNFEFKNYVMAEEATKAMEPNADPLEWSKKDNALLLHAVYCSVTLSVPLSE
ncbi:hypothetical protein OIU84_027420 [Salix udensis]|uniref:Uncharacterized protein n=1 Tax=Salix udensis TaxID=889485 RepID=A0AAD6PAY3_9ROSI|nr:hypothetical protein OIU84_027420 [Salix udensis]